jgi:predicted ATPase/DNA-binding winged helix-turn-helix (wHTH) protein
MAEAECAVFCSGPLSCRNARSRGIVEQGLSISSSVAGVRFSDVPCRLPTPIVSDRFAQGPEACGSLLWLILRLFPRLKNGASGKLVVMNELGYAFFAQLRPTGRNCIGADGDSGGRYRAGLYFSGRPATKDSAMMTSPAQTRGVISFGPFELIASERLLTNQGVPVDLGGRAFDILVALASRPNEAVSKKDLLAWVWPDATVEESSLRFHIGSVRRALGDGEQGARYIATLPGRGYCFVAPISRSSDEDSAPAPLVDAIPHGNLPNPLIRMVGRTDDVLLLSAQLTAARFMTIVGAGGVGKTTVAVAVGHHLIEAFAGAVLFVDLGMLSDPASVPTAVASMLGLSIQSDNPTPSIVAYLRNKRILLILDTCEHLVEAVAALALSIFTAAPHVHILATSRETLRVEGEHVYKLGPLACPPDDPSLTAAATQAFPAIQLFVERAVASGTRLEFGDAETIIIAAICRRLDGAALAIELAARRVEAYGLQQTAALLNQRLTLLWRGQRSAPPRQQTLQATLDWSYRLLSELERKVLRRLAVFVGYFSIDAALAVIASATVDQPLVFGTIDSLVAKSMVATRPLGAVIRYRLLDTTRAYALATTLDDADLAARHATYYQRWLEQTRTDWPTLSNAAERAPHLDGLHNVRAALEWCFGVNGDAEIGVGLAAAAAPVFLAMSLLTDCQRWSERAILALNDAARATREEMHLQAALGISSMYTRGNTEEARLALNRSLAIAEERDDLLNQVQLLGPLYSFHLRTGDFQTALRYAMRGSAISETLGDVGAVALAHSLLGISLHLTGDLGRARAELEAALEHRSGSHWAGTIYRGFDHHNWAGIVLARTLWLQGHPAQAVEQARRTVRDAARLEHPVTLAFVLNWAVSVFHWTGDLESAEELTDWLISHAESHSLAPYLAVGRGYKGELTIRRGDPKGGVESLQSCLTELHALRYEVLTTAFNISLVEGLAAIGRYADGMILIDQTIQLVEANGELTYMPELLRVKGGLFLSLPEHSDEDAEMCFKRSLELSRHQTARAWELRSAVDLATLLAGQGRSMSARTLLQPVFEQFVEGSNTADLKAAERLLVSFS